MSTGMGGDDVYTGRMGPRQNVSNYCSEAQISQIISELSRRAALPPHIIVWWTGPVNTIPFGWALANGVLNSPANGGSGIVVISKFVRGAASGAGNTEDATETSNDGHYHDVLIAPTETGEPVIQATLLPSKTGIDETEQPDFLTDPASVSGGAQDIEGGAHKHEGETEEVKVLLVEDGEHTHPDSETGETNVDPHTCGNVVDCIADHAAHIHEHNITRAAGIAVTTGSQNIRYIPDSSGTDTGGGGPDAHAAEGGAGLEHTAHKHPVTLEEAGKHTHEPEPHYHPLVFEDDGEHKHTLEEHSHTVTFGEKEEPHHKHKISDPGHTHPYEPIADPHGHDVTCMGGDHAHITGRPDNIKLLPIEKLDVL